MRIAVDGMGGDNAPREIVKGCVEVSKLISDEIIIVGDKTQIQNELRKYRYNKKQIKIVHAPEVIKNEDAPADLLISAGNTGAIMAGGLFILGRIQGIDRPAIAATYPVMGRRGVSLLVDAGANVECKPNNLLEFATMGSIYMQKVLDIERPTVGLVNIGTEENKGTTVVRAAYELLEKSSLNFIGNIEAREIPKGVCDVLVCDGFVGNIILKMTEGLAWNLLKLIKSEFLSDALSKLGALLLSGKLKELRDLFDYSEYGGAPILGVKGALVKMHGSSNANAVKNTILKGIPYAENNVVQMIQDSVLELEEVIISD
jgi:glycerol-3-phosphate acyltransferase PlsX